MVEFTLSEPHWLEPIVLPARKVTEIITYEEGYSPTGAYRGGTGKYVRKVRTMETIHEDGTKERMYLPLNATLEVRPL
jgi:hypothetical protein